jgi:acyl carrier protein
MSVFEAAKSEILSWVAGALEIPVEQIDPDKPFAELGLDSLDAVHMISTIEQIIKQELPEDVIQQVTCLNDMFEMMRQKLACS